MPEEEWTEEKRWAFWGEKGEQEKEKWEKASPMEKALLKLHQDQDWELQQSQKQRRQEAAKKLHDELDQQFGKEKKELKEKQDQEMKELREKKVQWLKKKPRQKRCQQEGWRSSW